MYPKHKAFLGIFVILICSLLVAMPGCSRRTSSTERETLVQISTIDAILNGVYDGVVTFRTLREYGDFGIATFAGLDGEIVGFDGNFY